MFYILLSVKLMLVKSQKINYFPLSRLEKEISNPQEYLLFCKVLATIFF